jgi:hypothetical protein
MTYEQFAQQKGITIEAVGAKFRAKYPGVKFNKHAEVAPDFVSRSAKKPAQTAHKKTEAVTIAFANDHGHDLLRNELDELRKREAAANEAAKQLQEELDKIAIAALDKQSSFQWLLDGINIAEIALVLLGSFLLLGFAGLIVGGIACAFYAHTVIKVRNPDVSSGTKNLGLSVCVVLSLCFAWLHGQSFFVLLNESITGALRFRISVALSWVMTLIPLFSIFQTRNINEK